MKRIIYLMTIFTISLLATSCEEDAISYGLKDDNGQEVGQKNILQAITISSVEDPQEDKSVVVSYFTDGPLGPITKKVIPSFLIYKDDGIINVTGEGSSAIIEELYKTPSKVYETGEVLQYDAHGNPERIKFYEEEFDEQLNKDITKAYTAEISYDKTHNPLFYTLQAGGIISILEDLKLNFNLSSKITEILRAKIPFPIHNPSQITYKDEDGETLHILRAKYVYDEESYPTSATITSTYFEGSESEQDTYSASFQYLD
ncbi:hypothetical protein SAMN04487911_10410 [Arenibacter nanhaiticus]|uniref:DUF4595 domain-containing protein n=2 Tax=Arenibacter nanhaiticus TaxID=558155 RepID=A0A1M6CQA1_9FLAO|nr:hypothetical protein SAMN04487911_10410 [Arenibacter nanhaiticus]